MKKYLLYTTIGCLSAFVLFTAFKNESAEVEKQNNEIQLAVEENLAIFASELEAECREKALKVAILKAEAKQEEKMATKPEDKPEFPSTNKPKPAAPTKPTTTTPPPPPPTVDAEPLPETPEKPVETTEPADPSTGTNAGKKENPGGIDPEKEKETAVEKAKSGVNKGKKKGGN